jgi:hypothetical protein
MSAIAPKMARGIQCPNRDVPTVTEPDQEGRNVAQRLLEIWNGASPTLLASLLSDDYRGHMLHLADGERDAAGYAAWIADFRERNSDVKFELVEQFFTADRIVSRLRATRDSGASGMQKSNGVNIARLDANGRLAEEWAIWSAWENQGELT